MKLVIAEKPSVGRSIASVLGASNKKNGYIEGNGYVVTWGFGHLAGFEEDKSKWDMDKLPVEPSDNFVISKDGAEQFEILKKLMERSDVQSLVCATDAGREGEAIFRYIYYAAGCKKPFERLWISSMTDSAVKEGFENLQDGRNFDNLYEAVVARDKADTIIGLSGTRLFSLLYKQGGLYGTPALRLGRVQTPTLSMIVKRERDIQAFVKEKYYKIHAIADIDGRELDTVSANIKDEQQASDVAEQIDGKMAEIRSVTEEEKTSAAPRLYDLTSLQRDCNKLFGYTAKETLDTVQTLYESKLCTYPRTDSQYLTDDMEASVKALIDIVADNVDFLSSIDRDYEISKCINNKKVSDHHAIIPTEDIAGTDFSKLSEKENNVLSLICTRLLSATSRRYGYKATTVVLTCSEMEFKANGRVVTDYGFKAVEDAYKKCHSVEKEDEAEKKENDKELPTVHEGDTFLVQGRKSEHFTQPPKHYTEASILTAMENAGAEEVTEEVERKGLGTTATRAAVIENLITTGYVERKKKQLLPTKRAYTFIDIVPEKLKSPGMTAEMENTLSLVARGQANATAWLEEIRNLMTGIVNEYKQTVIEDEKNPFGIPKKLGGEALGNCPHCNKEVKTGKYGAYCSGKCGMNISSVYGKELTEKQIKKLLNGESVSYTNKGYENTVYSEIEEYSYVKDEKTIKGFQWKSKGKKVS